MRRDESAHNKFMKSEYNVRFMLKDVFEFAEHQEKLTYGLSYKLKLTKNKDEDVLDKHADIANARI